MNNLILSYPLWATQIKLYTEKNVDWWFDLIIKRLETADKNGRLDV